MLVANIGASFHIVHVQGLWKLGSIRFQYGIRVPDASAGFVLFPSLDSAPETHKNRSQILRVILNVYSWLENCYYHGRVLELSLVNYAGNGWQ